MKSTIPLLLCILGSASLILWEIRAVRFQFTTPSSGQEVSDGQGLDLSSYIPESIRRSSTPSDRFLLVVNPPCGSCVSHHYRLGNEIRQDYRKVIVVDQNSEGKSEPGQEGAIHIRDEHGTLANKLHALLPPRAYELSGDFHVVKAERPENGETLVKWEN